MVRPRLREKCRGVRTMTEGLVLFEPHRSVGHVVDAVTGCWNWHGAVTPHGYGRIGLNGKGKAPVPAHRAYYMRERGPIPVGMSLDHLCRNPRCVNPAHLEVVTQRENVRRGRNTKLTQALVRQMRDEYAAGGVTQKGLATKYGLSKKSGWHILRGVKWQGV